MPGAPLFKGERIPHFKRESLKGGDKGGERVPCPRLKGERLVVVLRAVIVWWRGPRAAMASRGEGGVIASVEGGHHLVAQPDAGKLHCR